MYDFLNNIELVKKYYVDSAYIYIGDYLNYKDSKCVKKEGTMLLEIKDFISVLPVKNIETTWSSNNLTCYITGTNNDEMLVSYVLHLVAEEEASNLFLFPTQPPFSAWTEKEMLIAC